MIKTLFDIDYLAQYEPYHISRKRGKVREMEYKRKVDKKRIPTCNIMGVNIAAINMEWLVDYLEKNISEIKGDYICVSNVHTTVTSFEDADYCAIQNGGLMAIPDGGPLSTVGQKRGHKNMERTTGPSLMGEIFEISAKKGYTPLNKIKFLLNGVVYGKNLCVRGNVYIFKHYESGKIIIGDNVIINSASWANPIGCGDRTYFQINEKAVLTIGNNCGISNTAITCEEKVTIEDNVMIGSGCHIYDTDFHPLEYSERVKEYYKACPTKRKPVRICEGAFIGAGCYILKGVTIGEHAIVGAGSVVAKDIPAGEIWVGNPAKYIKPVEPYGENK